MLSFEQQIQLLDDEIALLNRLMDILEQEGAALLALDADALEAVTAEKNSTLALHRQLEQRRLDLGGEELQDRHAADLSADRRLQQRRDEVAALAARCQECNRHNGRLIAQRQQQARATLGILLQTDRESPTYSGSGDENAASANRLLGKA